MKLYQAVDIALPVVKQLAEHCEDGYCVIAGSIRRAKPEVKDIEIVKPFEVGLFATGFALMVNQWEKVKGEPTGRYAQRRIPLPSPFERGAGGEGIMLDIFIANPDNFGYILMLRTGSSDWNQHTMLPRLKGNGYKANDGHIWYKGAIVSTPDEAAMFRIMGSSFILPENRK